MVTASQPVPGRHRDPRERRHLPGADRLRHRQAHGRPTGRPEPGRPVSQVKARYEIRVGGRLGDMIRSAFPELWAWPQDGDTILSGVFADQAALYGVLTQIETLGLELIEVRRLLPSA